MVQTTGIITNKKTQWRHPKYTLRAGATTLLASFILSAAGLTPQIKQNEGTENKYAAVSYLLWKLPLISEEKIKINQET